MTEESFNKLGRIIYVFNEIELFINFIITHHIEPKDKEFFLDYILNTSVINFGAKIKILINLGIFHKTQIKQIRDYSSNRNVFAHVNRDSISEIILQSSPDSIEINIRDVIFKTNSEGKLVEMNYKEFLKEHILLQNEIIDFISDYILLNKIDTLYNHIGNLKLHKK